MDAHAELADLQNRFHLLEGDRKAFYEQSQLTLKQNKEVCDTLRLENKDLRLALGSLSKERGGGGESNAMLDAESDKIEVRLALLRKRQNQLQDANRTKDRSMDTLDDELRDLQRSSSRPAAEANPLMRQIRTLENRLDKAMIKYNEAQSIRKTYDQIVKRLKEERVNFDNQLGAIEATLNAKEHDYEELLLMSHDASHAKDVAKADLGRLAASINEDRKSREKELAERRSAVEARQQMNDRMEEREKARREIVLEAQGDLSEQAEQALKQNVVTNALHHTLNVNVVEGEQQVMGAYESAFRRIKESTGVADVNEVIQKFITQEQTHDNLVAMTKDAQTRIETLAEERAATKAAVDDIKYSGGSAQGSRQEVDQWERKLSDGQAAAERVKARQARFGRVFVDVRAGIEHMAGKLEAVKLDLPAVPITDETIADVMMQQEAKLLKMFEMASQMGLAEPQRPSTASLVGDAADAAGNSYNMRVPLDEDAEDDDDDDDDDGVEPEIPDRQMMKKLHGMMLDKANAKGKKKKKKADNPSVAPGLEGGKSASTGKLPGSRSSGRRDLE